MQPADIINYSFLDLGVIQPGDTISTAMQTDAFNRLNMLIDSLATEEGMGYLQVMQAFSLVAGTDAYTLGPGGTLVTTSSLRAQKVTAWRAYYSGVLHSGGRPLAMKEFAALCSTPNGETTPIPRILGADTAWQTSSPVLNIRISPPPSSTPGTLELAYWTPIPQFITVSDTVNLPPGWPEFLHFALAVKLYPQYAKASGIPPELAAAAQNAKAVIMQQNMMTEASPAQAMTPGQKAA